MGSEMRAITDRVTKQIVTILVKHVINRFITSRISKPMKGRGLTELYVPSVINRFILGHEWLFTL